MARYDDFLARVEYLDVKDPILMSIAAEIFAENADLKQENAKLKEESYFDELTMLPNKRNFKAYVQNQLYILEQQSQEKCSMYLAVCDADEFKLINDCFGHIEGDNALRHIANVLREVNRTSDFVSRLSGDEFGIVFTRINHPDEVEMIKNRIKQALLAHPFKVKNKSIPLMLSIGITPVDTNVSMSVEYYMELADQAMYLEKSANNCAR